MKIKKMKFLRAILIVLIISTTLSFNLLIFFSSNAEEINSNSNVDNSLELQKNDISYDLSSMKNRGNNKIEFVIKWNNFDMSRDIKHIFDDYSGGTEIILSSLNH